MTNETLALEVRMNLDLPLFRQAREQIAFSLTSAEGYQTSYSWELAGLLIETYLAQHFTSISELNGTAADLLANQTLQYARRS